MQVVGLGGRAVNVDVPNPGARGDAALGEVASEEGARYAADLPTAAERWCAAKESNLQPTD
jgi:hypothetical protein